MPSVLEKEGLVELKPVGVAACAVSLTAAGKAAQKNEAWRTEVVAEIRKEALLVNVGRREVSEVTGIVQGGQDNSLAVVEFLWAERFSDRGLAARKISSTSFPPVASGTGKATFRRYDDGWRIVDVSVFSK